MAVLALVVGLAWSTSPDGAGLGQRLSARLQATSGKLVALDQVSPLLREAVVATEDERFYRHHGIDLIGVARALPYDVVHLSFAQGASTITEQVAKCSTWTATTTRPGASSRTRRVALKLEGRYTKEQILAAYLNSATSARARTASGAASERYFGVAPGG